MDSESPQSDAIQTQHTPLKYLLVPWWPCSYLVPSSSSFSKMLVPTTRSAASSPPRTVTYRLVDDRNAPSQAVKVPLAIASLLVEEAIFFLLFDDLGSLVLVLHGFCVAGGERGWGWAVWSCCATRIMRAAAKWSRRRLSIFHGVVLEKSRTRTYLNLNIILLTTCTGPVMLFLGDFSIPSQSPAGKTEICLQFGLSRYRRGRIWPAALNDPRQLLHFAEEQDVQHPRAE